MAAIMLNGVNYSAPVAGGTTEKQWGLLGTASAGQEVLVDFSNNGKYTEFMVVVKGVYSQAYIIPIKEFREVGELIAPNNTWKLHIPNTSNQDYYVKVDYEYGGGGGAVFKFFLGATSHYMRVYGR